MSLLARRMTLAGCTVLTFGIHVAFAAPAQSRETKPANGNPPAAKTAQPVPMTAPIYNPAGGPDLRNPFRSDIAQCSQWYGGPAGTLVPAGMRPPPIPRPGLHGLAAAGGSGACGRWEALGQASAFKDGAFVRAMHYREKAGSYTAPGGVHVPYGYERMILSGGFGFARAYGSFVAFDATRAEKSDIRYAGAPMDSRFFDATTLSLRSRLVLAHPVIRAVTLNANWTDFDRKNDNFSYRALVGQPTLAVFDRQSATLDAGVEGRSGALDWSMGLAFRQDHRDATRFQGAGLPAQSPVIADGTVASYGVAADGKYALAPDRRLLAGIKLDFVSASLGGMDRGGMVTPGFGATPTPRTLFAATYGYAGSGEETEVNLGGSLRYEQDFDAARGRWFTGLRRIVRTADPRERYFVSFTPPAGGAGNPGAIHRTWIGNPGLAPEQHHIAEAGYGWAGSGWELAGRVYGDRVADFILWDRARGQTGVTRTDNVNIFRNVDAVIAGLEAKLRYRFGNGFWLGADGWLTYGRNLTDDRAIGQIPPAEAVLRVGWSNTHFEVETRWRLVATQTRVDAFFRNGSGVDGTGLAGASPRTAGFTAVDASASWKPLPNAKLTIGVENLFDRRYREHVERTDIDDPFTFNPLAAGRSVFARGTIQF